MPATVRILCCALLIALSSLSPADAGKVDKVDKCRGALASLLRIPGGDPSLNAFTVAPWPGSTTMGFDVSVPKTSLRMAAFYTRDHARTGAQFGNQNFSAGWNLAIALDEKNRGEAFVAKLVAEVSEWLGTPRFRSLVIILSEDDGKVQLGKLNPWLKDALSPFADADSYFRPRKTLSLKMGVNFFGTIQRGSAKVIEKLERIVLLGGRPESDEWAIQGSVSAEIFSRLLAGMSPKEASVPAEAKGSLADQARSGAGKVRKQVTDLPGKAKGRSQKLKDQGKALPGKAASIPGKIVDGAKKAGTTIKKKLPGGGSSDPDQDEETGGKIKGLGGTALDAARAANRNLRGAYFKVYFPAVTPQPFASMDASSAKKVLYQTFSPSCLHIERDRTEKAWSVIGNRVARVWILNRIFDISNDLSISYSSTATGKEFHVVNKGSLNISQNPLRLLDGLLTLKELHMLGELQLVRETRKAPEKPGKSHANHVDLNVYLGGKGDVGDLHDMDLTLNVAVDRKGGSTNIREIGVSLTGDLPLSKLPMLGQIPLVDEIVLKEASIGVGLGEDEGPDAYLAGALEWKDFTGEAALLMKTLNGSPQFLFMTRQENFSLRHVLEACPDKAIPLGTKGILDQSLEIFDTFALPKMVLMLSSIGGKDAKAARLKLADMPDRIQHLFDGIVTEADGKIPLSDDGISIIGAWDMDAVNQIIQCNTLQEVWDDLGVGKEMKRLALNSPLIVAGSVGGFRHGTLRAGIYVQLPELKFPGQGPLEHLMTFDSATQSFFLRLDLASFCIQGGVRGELKIQFPQLNDVDDKDETRWGGELYLNIDAVSTGLHLGAYRDGEWRNPLGLGNIAFTDTAVMVGVDSNMSLEMGLGGGIILDLPDGKSAFPSLLHPEESVHHLSQMMNGKTKQAVAEALDPKQGHVTRLKYGAGAMLGLTYLEEIVVPTKLALFYQADKIGPLWLLEYYDSLLRGFLTGPAAEGILKEAGKVMGDAAYKDFKYAFDVYKNQPNIVQMLHVDEMPLGQIEYGDLLVYFATPGAAIPGFPDIDGMGLKLRGKVNIVFFGTHELTGVDHRISLNDGFFLAGELGDLDLKFLSFKNARAEIHLGIPGLHPNCHFQIQGDTQFLADKAHALMEIRPLGVTIELERDLKPFLDVKFTLENDLKLEKLLSQPADVVDFTVRGEMKHESLQKIIQDAVVDGMMSSLSDDLNKAENGLKDAEATVKSWKGKISDARAKARRDMIRARMEAKRTAEAAHKGIDNVLDRARNRLKDTFKSVLNKLHLGNVYDKLNGAEKSAYNGFKSTLDHIDKTLIGGMDALNNTFEVPVDLDPRVQFAKAQYYLSLGALEVAYHTVHAARLANDTGKDALHDVVTNRFLQEPVEVRHFLLEATSHRSGRFTCSVDMTVLGKKETFDFQITADELAQGGAILLDRLMDRIIPGAGSPCQTMLDDLRARCKSTSSAGFDKNHPPDVFRLDGSDGYAYALAMQEQCGTRTDYPHPPKRPAYRVHLAMCGLDWAQTQQRGMAGRSYAHDFIMYDLDSGTPGMRQGEHVAILAPNNRFLTSQGKVCVIDAKKAKRNSGIFQLWFADNKNDKELRKGATFFLHDEETSLQFHCIYDDPCKQINVASKDLGAWEKVTVTEIERLPDEIGQSHRVWEHLQERWEAQEEAKRQAAQKILMTKLKQQAEAAQKALKAKMEQEVEAARKLARGKELLSMPAERREKLLAKDSPAQRRADEDAMNAWKTKQQEIFRNEMRRRNAPGSQGSLNPLNKPLFPSPTKRPPAPSPGNRLPWSSPGNRHLLPRGLGF